MRPSALIFAILAIVLGLGTAIFARTRLSEARQQVAQPDAKVAAAYVLVAARDLPSGTLMHDDDLTWQSWPDDRINDAYLRKDRDDPHALDGAVVRLRIAKGEPVGIGRVVKQGDRGFLAAVLRPGMRATSIPLTATSDVAGLILPGDHVDLILSHPIADERQPNAPQRMAGETVLTDLRVVAIDQNVNDTDKKPLSGKTATFEVTPKQAEIIEVAKLIGNLSLVLRSAGEDPAAKDEAATGPTHTWDSEVSPLIRHQELEPAAQTSVTVLRGAGASEATISIGGGSASPGAAATPGTSATGGNAGAAGAKGIASQAMASHAGAEAGLTGSGGL